jgi:hypothetical protein
MNQTLKLLCLTAACAMVTSYAQASDVIYNSTTGATYAYILNEQSNANSFTKCSVDANGIEEYSCTNVTPVDESGQPVLNDPDNMVLYANYAYITNYSYGAITECPINANGIDATNCKNILPTASSKALLTSAAGIAFNGNYGYILNGSGENYVQCSIKNNQLNLNACTKYTPRDKQGNLLLTKSDEITFNNSFAYFVDTNYSATFTKCQTGAQGIILKSCKNFVLPYNLTTTTNLAFHQQQAYFVSSTPAGEIVYSRCGLDSSGINVGSCIDEPVDIPVSSLNIPMAINFNANIMYITVVGLDIGSSKDVGSYVECQTSESGIKPGTCFTTTANFLKIPGTIVFNSVN